MDHNFLACIFWISKNIHYNNINNSEENILCFTYAVTNQPILISIKYT